MARTTSVKISDIVQNEIDGSALGVAPSIYDTVLSKCANDDVEFTLNVEKPVRHPVLSPPRSQHM